jgi:site-specific DNA recombinase
MKSSKPSVVPRLSSIPCAIYTRKSSEEGLEQGFNSLDAQREACAAYIQSQKAMGWIASPVLYDDGGYSGGNTDRPGLQLLLADIQAKRIKVVVVYKVDRLTRSLADFAKLVELFDGHGVSFVSVTQQFNTTTSMGRLTLNVLLSFAQFEREVTGERIRDKIAASKRKGMWMGGMPPMGYVPRERSLAIDEEQALKVRDIFKLYLDLGCVRRLKVELDKRGWTTPERKTKRLGQAGNKPFSRGHLYRILGNPVYIGQISHKGETFDGNHVALIDREVWSAVQEQLQDNRQGAKGRTNATNPSLLAGLVFDANGARLIPTHARKNSRRYRYYVSACLHEESREADPEGFRIPAHELEEAVLNGARDFLGDEARMLDWLDSREGDEALSVREVRARAQEVQSGLQMDARWQLPAIIERIMLQPDRMDIAIKSSVLTGQEEVDQAEPIWLSVPVGFRRSGRTMRLILNNQAEVQKTEKRLIDLLAKAHDWLSRLTSGRSDGVGAIAAEEGCTASFVTRVIYLAFLAPDIVQRVAQGNCPAELTAEKMIRMVPLPEDWGEQRRLLGID